MGHRSKFRGRGLNCATREVIDTVFLEHGIKLVDHIFEECPLNLRSLFIDQFNIHQVALSAVVPPAAPVAFLCKPSLDAPFVAHLGGQFGNRDGAPHCPGEFVVLQVKVAFNN